MSDPGTRLQTEIINGRLRCGLCRTILKACLGMIVLVILLQIFSPDVSAGWKVIQWQPFQIRKALMLKPGKSESGKRRKSVTDHPVEIRDSFDARTSHLQGFEQIWPDGQSRYISELSARIWGGYLWRAGAFLVLPQRIMQGEAPSPSDISWHAISQDDLLPRLAERAPAAVKDNGIVRYFRISFVNRDLPYLGRNISGRDAGRNSAWEKLLLQPTDMLNQPGLEIVGKIFEPRVDLGIEF